MSPKEAESWWRRNQLEAPEQVVQIAVVMDLYSQRSRGGAAATARRGRPSKFSDLDLQLLSFVLGVLENATGRESKPGHHFSATATLTLIRAVLRLVGHPHADAARALNDAISKARTLSPISIFV